MPVNEEPRRITVIGAGISGLTCATELAERGCSVTVFDKARGPGGRMSNRRVPHLGVGACGDWTNGNRVEGAFLSGLRLAEEVERALRR